MSPLPPLLINVPRLAEGQFSLEHPGSRSVGGDPAKLMHNPRLPGCTRLLTGRAQRFGHNRRDLSKGRSVHGGTLQCALAFLAA